MNGRYFALRASSNPFVQALALIVLGAALIGAVVLGAVILAAMLGVAVIAAIVISVRVWWLKRKLRRRAATEGSGSAPQSDRGRLIEAEYTVLRERRASREREE